MNISITNSRVFHVDARSYRMCSSALREKDLLEVVRNTPIARPSFR